MTIHELKPPPPPPLPGGAPLKNMELMDLAIRQAVNRDRHLPGMVCFSGPSGFGKSFAAGYAAGRHGACYVEVRSVWTKKALLVALARQLGLAPARTLSELSDQVAEAVALSRQVMIFDEMDNAVDRGLVELIRDIYESSHAPIVLIGEERLPQKLQRWERFHGRVLDWHQAQPADLEDARSLARHYLPSITVADDLLSRLVEICHGSVRRICVNIELIRQYAHGAGAGTVTLKDWGKRPLHTGHPPSVRKFA
jgi:hypothetical protein